MLSIDQDLLSNASHTPHRAALERGYRGLRFEGDLERDFARFYTEGNLDRIRFAAYLVIALYAVFVGIDLQTLPGEVAMRTVAIRLGLIMPAFIVVLVVSYRTRLCRYLTHLITAASLVAGVGTVAIIGTAFSMHSAIPYEGILLVALFIYLITCLPWWRALAVNLVTLAAFIGMEVLYQADPQARLYQIVFMGAANAVGAYGAYFLEYSARTMFLVNTLLNELAEMDGLTGLANRRTFNLHLDRTWRQAARENGCVAVAMVDVDHFKLYNDHYGHAQGDVALRAVAEAIARQARRPLDIVARYGGEEFVLLWYNPIPEQLASMGAALVAAVAALQMEHVKSAVGRVSVSVGVAWLCPGKPGAQNQEHLLRLADNALYDAKHAGRDQVALK
jgi:diguanylate cyclase (GGDEF)-like protein